MWGGIWLGPGRGGVTTAVAGGKLEGSEGCDDMVDMSIELLSSGDTDQKHDGMVNILI